MFRTSFQDEFLYSLVYCILLTYRKPALKSGICVVDPERGGSEEISGPEETQQSQTTGSDSPESSRGRFSRPKQPITEQ